MRFNKRVPKREGFYWVKPSSIYVPRLAKIGDYADGSGKWITFFYHSEEDSNRLKDYPQMRFSKRVEDPYVS